MSHNTEEMLKHIKIYIFVFVALAVLTVLTVWASYIHVSPALHVTIAMAIATVKGGLVVAYFMHMVSEKKLIYSVCLLTAFFFIFMLLVTYFADTTMAPLAPDLF